MTRNILTISLLLMTFLCSFAQNGNQPVARTASDSLTVISERTNSKQTKKTDKHRPKADSTSAVTPANQTDKEVGTLEAEWKPVIVDHVFGIRAGYGSGSMRREPSRQNQTLASGLMNFGISYRFDVPAHKYVGMIEFDLQFMQKGFAYALSFDGDEIYSRRYSVIEFPILWQPYLPLGKGESRFFLNAGPYVSYTLGGFERTYDKKTGQTISGGEYIYDPLRDNRIEYGIVAGAGIMIGIKRFSFSFDFRYNIMLSDALKSVTKYKGNPFRSPVDQMSLSLALQYRFIKGRER